MEGEKVLGTRKVNDGKVSHLAPFLLYLTTLGNSRQGIPAAFRTLAASFMRTAWRIRRRSSRVEASANLVKREMLCIKRLKSAPDDYVVIHSAKRKRGLTVTLPLAAGSLQQRAVSGQAHK
jgi:hypothetical protein